MSVTTGVDHEGHDRIFIAEQGSHSNVQRGGGLETSQLHTWTPNIGHRIGIYDPSTGQLLAKIGASTPGERPNQFNWLHSISVDSEGSVYAAEVNFCECGRFQKPHSRELVSLRKWRLKK